MSKYRVDFSGFAYVEANDQDEARELVEEGMYVYMEYESRAREIEEFEVVL